MWFLVLDMFVSEFVSVVDVPSLCRAGRTDMTHGFSISQRAGISHRFKEHAPDPQLHVHKRVRNSGEVRGSRRDEQETFSRLPGVLCRCQCGSRLKKLIQPQHMTVGNHGREATSGKVWSQHGEGDRFVRAIYSKELSSDVCSRTVFSQRCSQNDSRVLSIHALNISFEGT